LVAQDGSQVVVPVAAVMSVSLDTFLLGTVVNEELFAEIAGDQPVSLLYLRSDPDRVDQLGTDLDNLVGDYTGIEVLPGNFIGQILGDVIDFLIAAVNGLLGLSVLVALVGIINTMNLSIHERRRELGMVRALGMTRSQVKSMVRVEAFFIGVLGTLIGMGAGVFLGWVVVGSVTDGGVGLNWARIGLILGAGVAISVVASLLPARSAVKVEMLEAMQST
jgi:putative ABC transport system permease protein